MKDIKRVSEQLLDESTQGNPPALGSGAVDFIPAGDGHVSSSRGRLGTPFPANLMHASGQIRAESHVDAIGEEDEAEETSHAVKVLDENAVQRSSETLQGPNIAGLHVSENEGEATPPTRRVFFPKLFQRLKSPGGSGRKLGANQTA